MLSLILGLMLTATMAAVLAENEFHVHYRVDNLTTDEHNVSGTLLLNVYNTSGEDASDLVASIPESNQVIYGQRQIWLGDLPDGEQVEVLDQFIIPIELTEMEPTSELLTWRREYTCALGEPRRVEVVGQRVQ